MKTNFVVFLVMTLYCAEAVPQSSNAIGEATELTKEVVATDLANPSGLAIRPGTAEIFITESGRGRVVRWSKGETTTVVLNLPQESYGKFPSYTIGPLGIRFLDSDTFLVGEGGQPAGKDRLITFKISSDEHNKSLAKIYSETALGVASDEASEGNFYGIGIAENSVVVTSHGSDTKGWIAKASLDKTGIITQFEKFIATQDFVPCHAPTALCMRRELGSFLVSHFGETNVAYDSVVSEFTVEGEHLAYYFTGLNDITGLSISPANGNIYAIDFNWIDPKTGGLYQLDDFDKEKHTCSAKKLMSLERPTAMCFDDAGDLWVTQIGPVNKSASSGSLLKITGIRN